MIEVVYEAGPYKVAQHYKYTCQVCREGWNAGTLTLPRDGGEPCPHGMGQWQVGVQGPRGGWHFIGPRYRSQLAAETVADALCKAGQMPAQGRK